MPTYIPSANDAQGLARTFPSMIEEDFPAHNQYFATAKFWGKPHADEVTALWRSMPASLRYLQLFTCGVGDAVGDPVILSSTTTVQKALATTYALGRGVVGFITHKPTTTSCYVAHYYYKTGLSGLTPGLPVFLSDTGTVSATPGTARILLGTAISTTTALLKADVLDSVNYRPYVKNEVINGGAWFFQRGAGAVTMTDGVYNGPDRFYSLIQGSGPTVQQVASAAGFNSPSSMRITSGGTTNRGGLATALESFQTIPLRGRQVTFNYRCYASRNSGSGTINVRAALIEWTGTADSITKDVVSNWASGTFTPSNFFVASNINLLATSNTAITHNTQREIALTATVGGSANNLMLFVWLQDVPNHANDYVNISEVGLYDGPTAPPWSPLAYQQEFVRCLRYCYVPNAADGPYVLGGLGARESTNLMLQFYKFPVPMRGTPTITSNISTTWATTAPGTTQIAAFRPAGNAFVTISGALAIGLTASTRESAYLQVSAGTSFSGSQGDVIYFLVGPSVVIVHSAEL